MSHRSWVRLRSAFYSAGFTTARSMWNGIVGEDSQLFIEKGATHSKSRFLQHCLSIAPCGGKRAGKADAIQRRAMPARRLEHKPARQLMDQKVHAQFPFDVSRVHATQVFHLQRRLEIAQSKFHFPAAQIELPQSMGRVFDRVGECGDKDDFPGAKAPYAEPAAHHSQRQLAGELSPLGRLQIRRAKWRLLPMDQAVLGAEASATAEVEFARAAQTEHPVDATAQASGHHRPYAKAAISQQDFIHIQALPKRL